MFNFGLLTTHLPYMVLVVAYVFCLITYPGSKSADEAMKFSSDKNIITEIRAFEDTIETTALFYDFFYSKINDASLEIFAEIDKSALFKINSDERFLGEPHCFKSFSRPPPIIA